MLIYFKTDVSIDHGAQLLISIRLDSLFQDNFVVVAVGISFYKVLPTSHSCRYAQQTDAGQLTRSLLLERRAIVNV